MEQALEYSNGLPCSGIWGGGLRPAYDGSFCAAKGQDLPVNMKTNVRIIWRYFLKYSGADLNHTAGKRLGDGGRDSQAGAGRRQAIIAVVASLVHVPRSTGRDGTDPGRWHIASQRGQQKYKLIS